MRKRRWRGRIFREYLFFSVLSWSLEYRSVWDDYTDDMLVVAYRPHTLGADELYQAHLAPQLSQAQGELDSKLDTVQKENIQLAEKIARQRQEIQQLLSGLEAVVGDVQGAVGAVRDFDADKQLRKDAEEMDDEIKASQQR